MLSYKSQPWRRLLSCDVEKLCEPHSEVREILQYGDPPAIVTAMTNMKAVHVILYCPKRSVSSSYWVCTVWCIGRLQMVGWRTPGKPEYPFVMIHLCHFLFTCSMPRNFKLRTSLARHRWTTVWSEDNENVVSYLWTGKHKSVRRKGWIEILCIFKKVVVSF